MPGLAPGIHALLDQKKAWMAGTSPAMTAFDSLRLQKALKCGSTLRNANLPV
jgi:hypothetical protein